MRRKPKTESRQRNNRSLNTVGVPASAYPAGHPFDRRSFLFAAGVRICCCDCPARTGSFVRSSGVAPLPRGQTPCRQWRVVTCGVLSRTGSAPFQSAVADLRARGIGRTDRIAGCSVATFAFPKLAGQTTNGLIDKVNSGHFSTCLRIQLGEINLGFPHWRRCFFE